MRKDIIIFPLNEDSLILKFGDVLTHDIHQKVYQATNILLNHPFKGFIELVPAYTTITVYFDSQSIPSSNPFQQVEDWIYKRLERMEETKGVSTRNIIEIPVCYDEEFALDLIEISKAKNMPPSEMISLHSQSTYHVYFIGFSPGFPFLGDLDKKLYTERKKTPRLSVPAGSVGIAGLQTGIYPSSTPGGWNIIGRTPKVLFHSGKDHPSVLNPGDQVTFFPISKDEFFKWEETH